MERFEHPVESLRCCIQNPPETCVGCTYNTDVGCNVARMMSDAADAIEALQAELEKKRTADCWGCKCEKMEPKRGEWINHKDEHQCSVCRETVVVDEIRWEQIGAYDYCPNCGAKMMEVQE